MLSKPVRGRQMHTNAYKCGHSGRVTAKSAERYGEEKGRKIHVGWGEGRYTSFHQFSPAQGKSRKIKVGGE